MSRSASLGSRSLALALVLFLVLAGCSSKGGKQASVEEPEAPTASFSEETGGIIGNVYEDIGLPIEGVQVGIIALGLSTVTDELGRYALSDVPPGTYDVDAIKLKFVRATAKVTIIPGQAVPVDLEMSAVEDPQDPYHVVDSANGYWTCAVGNPAVPPSDPCASTSEGTGSNVWFQKPVHANVSQFVVSVEWTPSSGATGNGKILVTVEPLNVPGWTASTTKEETAVLLKDCYKCEYADASPGVSITVIGERGMAASFASTNLFDPAQSVIVNTSAEVKVKATLARGAAAETATWGGLAFQQKFCVMADLMYWGYLTEAPTLEQHATQLWGEFRSC